MALLGRARRLHGDLLLCLERHAGRDRLHPARRRTLDEPVRRLRSHPLTGPSRLRQTRLAIYEEGLRRRRRHFVDHVLRHDRGVPRRKMEGAVHGAAWAPGAGGSARGPACDSAAGRRPFGIRPGSAELADNPHGGEFQDCPFPDNVPGRPGRIVHRRRTRAGEAADLARQRGFRVARGEQRRSRSRPLRLPDAGNRRVVRAGNILARTPARHRALVGSRTAIGVRGRSGRFARLARRRWQHLDRGRGVDFPSAGRAEVPRGTDRSSHRQHLRRLFRARKCVLDCDLGRRYALRPAFVASTNRHGGLGPNGAFDRGRSPGAVVDERHGLLAGTRGPYVDAPRLASRFPNPYDCDR